MNNKSKILLCVEGEKTDYKLMKYLFEILQFNISYEIVSYNTNIWVLYDDMFSNGHPEDYDLLGVLRERENNPEKKKRLLEKYSDVLLVFDMDPQDNRYSAQKLQEMCSFFSESTDEGKLYINYPMVESFFHVKTLPDPEFLTRFVSQDVVKNRKYKELVNKGCLFRDYKKIIKTKNNCCIIILQNHKKGTLLIDKDQPVLNQKEILEVENKEWKLKKRISVLNTCCLFFYEYNPSKIC